MLAGALVVKETYPDGTNPGLNHSAGGRGWPAKMNEIIDIPALSHGSQTRN
jgi:hypothetical protein